MAVSTGTTQLDGSTVLVSVSGTDAEVRAELATASSVGASYAWNGDPNRIIASGGDATACFVIYKT